MIDEKCIYYKPGFRNDDIGMYINSHKCTRLNLHKKDLECKDCRVRRSIANGQSKQKDTRA